MLNKIIVILILVIIAYFSYSLFLNGNFDNSNSEKPLFATSQEEDDGLVFISGKEVEKQKKVEIPAPKPLPVFKDEPKKQTQAKVTPPVAATNVRDYSKEPKTYQVKEGGAVFIANDGTLIGQAASSLPEPPVIDEATKEAAEIVIDAVAPAAETITEKAEEQTDAIADLVDEITPVQEEEIIIDVNNQPEAKPQEAKPASEPSIIKSKEQDLEVQRAILQLYPARHFMMGMSDYEAYMSPSQAQSVAKPKPKPQPVVSKPKPAPKKVVSKPKVKPQPKSRPKSKPRPKPSTGFDANANVDLDVNSLFAN